MKCVSHTFLRNMFRLRIFPEGDFTYSWESPPFPGSCPPRTHPLSYTLTFSQAQYLRVPLPTKSYFFLFYPVFLFPTLPHRKPALSSVTGTSELFSKWHRLLKLASYPPVTWEWVWCYCVPPTPTHTCPVLQADLWNLSF